jgi:hypothetical protein
MSENSVDPGRTFAVVVGIDKYDIGSEWDLNGPANDAHRFIQWLSKQDVPSDNIYAFVSTDDAKLSGFRELGVAPRPAEHGLIRDTLTNKLASVSGDLLCFYWGGHGVIDARGNRRLYCADATKINPLHISLNSLLQCWRTDIIGSFPNQVGFVDACANYLEFYRAAASMPEDVLPSGTPAGVEQFFLLAASAGEVAKNLSAEKSGAFSRTLFELLEGSKKSLPPPMKQINQQLLEGFAELRDAGKMEQTPSHFWYRDWQGAEGTIASLKRVARAAPPAEAQLTNEQRDEIVLALLEFEVMAGNQERRSVIADLRREIKFSYSSSQIARLDVDNLVRTVLRYPYGLQELIRVVERFKGADETAWQNLKEILNRLGLQYQ